MADLIKFDSLQPDSFSSEQVWLDFMDAAAEVIQEQIREPIGEIEEIRNIVESTDPEIISNTLKMMGFDLPADIIAHNAQRLSRSVYMLALFHEISGIDGFERSIAYVLGREVTVTNLWTNNYVDFYSVPYGPLLQEGGDWYQATHISLGMELLPSDAQLVLPEDSTIGDRLRAAYFEFAPINEVVHDFYFRIQAQMTMGIAGEIFVDPTHRKTFGQGNETVQKVYIVAPTVVNSSSSFQLFADVLLSPDTCFDIGSPIWGNISNIVGLTSEQIVENELDVLLSNMTSPVYFSLVSGYGYVAVPDELGTVRFVDSNGFIGGWDGASWPDNGTVGPGTGPVQVTRTIDGIDRVWNLYRTDLPSIGNVTYTIEYEFSGTVNSCDIILPIEEPTGPVITPDGECTTEQIPLLPIYGEAPAGLSTGAALDYLETEFSDTHNTELKVTVASQYGYFAYPIELGLANFLDTTIGLYGGWEGATWPADGSEGTTFSPIIVSRTVGDITSDWYVYRTDWPFIGSVDYIVEFDNPGIELFSTLEVCTSVVCVRGYPSSGVSAWGVDTEVEVDLMIDTIFANTANRNFQLTLGAGEYGYFAYPADLGVAVFTDVNTGFVGSWDGATWADGSVGPAYGPMLITRNIGGQNESWFLHRTDWTNLGEIEFNVTFPYANLCVDEDVASPPMTTVKYCTINSNPLYGVGQNINSEAEILALGNASPDTENDSITINTSGDDFGYFAYPAALGEATITDDDAGSTTDWNGATWPNDGTTGVGSGPAVIEVNLNGIKTHWFFYRTNVSGAGEKTYNIVFERPGIFLGNQVECDLSGYPVPAVDYIDTSIPDCEMTGFPRYGSSQTNLETDTELADLPIEITETTSITLSVDLASQYGFFSYPVALGEATFVDQAVGLPGGWDGATWPDDGNIASTFGPKIIVRELNGIQTEWFVYRTDWTNIGQVDYTVTFANGGLIVGDVVSACDTSSYPGGGTLVNNTPSTGSCLVSGVSRFGSGGEINTEEEIAALPYALSKPDNEVFSFTVQRGEYGYFVSPAALGVVTFIDTDTNVIGGWGGATWPYGYTYPEVSGPTVISRVIDGVVSDWFLYRTEVVGLGLMNFRAEFQNRGLTVGESIDCDTSSYPSPVDDTTEPIIPETPPGLVADLPLMGEGPIGINSVAEADIVLDTVYDNRIVSEFSVNLIAGEYGYFMHPAYLGLARFTDVDNDLLVGWQGASWPDDGTVGDADGPIVIYRTTGSGTKAWYLYRTDWPGIGAKTFSVTFGNAVPEPFGNFRNLRIVVPEWSTDRPDVVSINSSGEAFFGNVSVDTLVTLNTTYNNITDSVQILVRASEFNLISLEIEGPDTVNGGSDTDYVIKGYYADGSVRIESSTVMTCLTPYAVIKYTATLSAFNPEEDTVVFLSAQKLSNDGSSISVAKQVTINTVSDDVYVTSVAIVGPSSIVEDTTENYKTVVTYSDGSSATELALMESSSPGLWLDNSGEATAGIPQANYDVTLTSKVQFKGITTTAVRKVSVVKNNVTQVALHVQGPDAVVELDSAQYSTFVEWSNGTYTSITPEWQSTRFSIDSEGKLTTGSVGSTTILTLRAKAAGFTTDKTVSVYSTPNDIEYITVTGPEHVNEGDIADFNVLLHYTDGRNVPHENIIWNLIGSPQFASITEDGAFTFNDPTEDFGTMDIQAIYQDGGISLTQTRTVVLIPLTPIISSLTVIGPDEVLEGKRITLSATATFTDGSEQVVSPVWTARSSDPVNEVEVPADVVSPGIVQGRQVDEDTVIIVEARYFKEVAEYPVVVKNYVAPGPDVPITHRIVGSSIIDSNQTGSYVLFCQFDNTCSEEIALSNDWSLIADDGVAAIDQNGYLRSLNGEVATVTVVATWEYAGHYIREEFEVQINKIIPRITSVIIYGPTVAAEKASHTYTVEAFREGDTVVQGGGEIPDPSAINWTIDPTNDVSISTEGVLNVGDVSEELVFNVNVSVFDQTYTIETSKEVRVEIEPEPFVSLLITGPSVLTEQSSADYSVEAFRNNQTIIAGEGELISPDYTTWNISPDDGTTITQNGLVTIADIIRDTEYTIQVDYDDGLTSAIVGTRVIEAIADPEPFVSMLVHGSDGITDDSAVQYTAELFRNGENVVAGSGTIPTVGTVSWSVSPSTTGLSIASTGMLTVGSFDADFIITVTAVYDDSVVNVTGNLTVDVSADPEPFVSARIIGVLSLYEETTETYYVEAYRNGQPTTEGTGETVPNTDVTWGVNPLIGISDVGSFDSFGTYTAPIVTNDITPSLVAVVNHEGFQVGLTKTITVVDAEDPYFQVILLGDVAVFNGTTVQYSAEAFNETQVNAGSTTAGTGTVPADLIWSINPVITGIDVDSNGLVTIDNATAGGVQYTVQASSALAAATETLTATVSQSVFSMTFTAAVSTVYSGNIGVQTASEAEGPAGVRGTIVVQSGPFKNRNFTSLYTIDGNSLSLEFEGSEDLSSQLSTMEVRVSPGGVPTMYNTGDITNSTTTAGNSSVAGWSVRWIPSYAFVVGDTYYITIY
jgi:hypothetical protein